MARTQDSLEFLASLFMPADVGKRGVLIEPTKGWRFEAGRVPAEADVVVWGTRAARAERGLPSSVLWAFKRELALRTVRHRLPQGFVQTGVHRLPPLILRPRSTRGRLSAAVFSGALVEAHRARGTVRNLDALADAADVSGKVRRIRPGAGTSAWARARRADDVAILFRLGAIGGASDPHRAAACLERLKAARVGQVPRLVSRGRRDLVSWTAESVLAGKTPKRLTPSLAAATARFLSSLPMSTAPPTAPRDDLVTIREALPSRSGEIEALAIWMDTRLGSLPAVLRHGDLWAGNLLTERGSLTGVIDWDAWHPEGVPGADLMYLVVMDRALRTGRPSGRIWREDPWHLPAFRRASPSYWSRLHLAPDEAALEAVSLAGWAAQAASALRRAPELASTPRWVQRIIDPILPASLR